MIVMQITPASCQRPVFPFHCHALNDLTFEKTNSLVVFQTISYVRPFCSKFFEADILVAELDEIHPHDYQETTNQDRFSPLSPFRAPLSCHNKIESRIPSGSLLFYVFIKL